MKWTGTILSLHPSLWSRLRWSHTRLATPSLSLLHRPLAAKFCLCSGTCAERHVPSLSLPYFAVTVFSLQLLLSLPFRGAQQLQILLISQVYCTICSGTCTEPRSLLQLGHRQDKDPNKTFSLATRLQGRSLRKIGIPCLQGFLSHWRHLSRLDIELPRHGGIEHTCRRSRSRQP